MKKILSVVILAALASVSQTGIAKETGAGCGIGKKIMEGESGTGAHLAAWALNNMILPQSLSQTSGILGCDTSQQVNNDKQKELFIASNIDSLSVDMAQGKGEHLSILASLMGIARADQETFFELTQEKYASIFSSTDTDAHMMLTALNTQMAGKPELASYVN